MRNVDAARSYKNMSSVEDDDVPETAYSARSLERLLMQRRNTHKAKKRNAKAIRDQYEGEIYKLEK